jgi:hypothetical protein
LLFNVWLLRVALPAVLAMLVVFTVYLVYQLITEGNDANCGCFGTYLEMNPAESIVKNVMMAGVAGWLLKTRVQWDLGPMPPYVNDKYMGPAIVVLGLVMPFVLNPIGAAPQPKDYGAKYIGQQLALDALYGPDNPTPPTVDLRKGKHILALMSLKCPHCKVAALKMNVMHRRAPQLPIYYVLRGKAEERLQPFLTETQHTDVPYTVYNGDAFFEISGGAVPAIYRLNNGLVEGFENEHTLNEAALLEWLNKK